MMNGLRNEAKGNGIPDTPDALQAYFLDKMNRNLHINLCFSPVGNNFRIMARKFPGMINCTSINFFHPWPKNALIDVASNFLSDIEFPDEKIKDQIALNMAEVHSSIDEANEKFFKIERRYNYTTPKSFLELIEFYKSTLVEKRSAIVRNI
mmetsp:Transcript_1247/g.1745  ORF Transcript_1247/g.1745 Transcript_1247/m.1745 type:complete len:151 (-) Transcript_1247:4462-4914(-)